MCIADIHHFKILHFLAVILAECPDNLMWKAVVLFSVRC